MKVAIVKYNAGNTQSVINSLERLGIDPILTDNAEVLAGADKVIFPGVGEASTTMQHLRNLQMDRIIPGLKQPVLGICLGMQLMCAYSEENDTQCLGIFDLNVKKFIARDSENIPHMGWNTVFDIKSPLFSKNHEGEHFYFVHSYYVPENEFSCATTDYITNFCSAIQRDNFYAVQFHPEKSSSSGLNLIENFIKL